ncbi:MAG: hypothetical protein WA761_01585 [Thermoplasmata archaeon]
MPTDRSLDIYLFPAIVGGGLGDIEEVLAAGRWLSRSGLPLTLYRRSGTLPRSVDGPWDWPKVERRSRLSPRAPRALTISPAWGISAAPPRDEPLGRGGAWSAECSEIESTYGTQNTLHVSLEEFARVLTSPLEDRERFREGGVPRAEARRRQRSAGARVEREQYHRAFRRFRGMDRSNVLHFFATFRPSEGFAREYPEVIQTGPLWPGRYDRSQLGPPRRSGKWVWYASPSSSSFLLDGIEEGLHRAGTPIRWKVRSPHRLPWPGTLGEGTDPTVPCRSDTWARWFREADLRIVTGSRSLLEAIELGRPWIYFNGRMGQGRRGRAHRPEKLRNLLTLWPVGTSAGSLRSELRAFAVGHRVAEIIERFAREPDRFRDLYRTPPRLPFEAPYDDLGRLVCRVASEWGSGGWSVKDLVRSVRARQWKGPGAPLPAARSRI